MKQFLMILISLSFVTLLSCGKEQTTQNKVNEKILTIKYRIYFGECLGYCNNQLVLDTTNVIYIQNGWDENGDLPEKDTVFSINQKLWEKVANSFSLNDFFLLDSAYISGFNRDDGLVTIEVQTNKRYKMIRHDYSRSMPVLDSLYSILNNLRKSL